MKIEVTVFHRSKCCTTSIYEIRDYYMCPWKRLQERGMRITYETSRRRGSIAISLDHRDYTEFAIELILLDGQEDEVVKAIETLLERIDFAKLDRWFIRMEEINKRILSKEENEQKG